MASNEIVTSFDSGRLAEARRWLAARSGGSSVIAPMKAACDELALAVAENGNGLVGVQRFSPGSFFLSLASPMLVQKGMAPIGGLGFEALVARSVNRLAQSGRLRYFEPIAQMPGFPRAVARTAEEMRMNRVSGESLRGGNEQDVDLADILDELAGELAARRLADPALIRRLALERVESDREPPVPPDLLFLDYVPGSRIEMDLTAALSRWHEDVLAVLPAWDRDGIRSLVSLLGTRSREVGGPEVLGKDLLDHCRRFLFAESLPDPPSEKDRFEFFSAPGEDRECVEIARRILALADLGIRFDEIAILLRDAGFYQGPLSDALASAGIPAHFSRGTPRPNPPGRAFMALLDCAAEGLSSRRMAEFLSFENHPRWDDLLDRAEGARDLPTWRRLLAGLAAETRVMLNRLEGEEPVAAGLNRRLERLDDLTGVVFPLLEQLAAWPSQLSWGEWLVRLESLAGEALKDGEPIRDVLRELEPMGEVGPVGLEEVRRVLQYRLRDTTDPPSSDRYGRVFVGPVESAAGRSFEVVFLPGLAEGLFPRKVLEDPILLDDRRRILDPVLKTRQSGIAAERRLLLAAVGVARSRLFVSHPRIDLMQGRGRVPSLFALELLRAVKGAFPELSQLDRESGVESAFRLGWPAPLDPMAAIDPSEFDLARLGTLLYGTSNDLRGRGRFLLQVNPWLARSVRARYKRWQQAWSDDDGIVAPREPEVKEILSSQLLTERSFSPTALQNFSRCPYRFFLYAILKLQPRGRWEPVEQMNPLVRGSLIHETQFRLFERLEAEGLLPTDQAPVERLLDLLDEVLNETVGSYESELMPALPAIWQTQVEEVRVDLRTWVREMAADEGWLPVRWELSFGLPKEPGRDPRSQTEEVVLKGGFRVRGAVDLVEQRRDTGALRVTDHKTGRSPVPEPRVVGGGESLQPLLYAIALEQLFPGTEISSGLYYCTQRGGFRRLDFPLNANGRQAVSAVLELINRSIDTGFLPAAPREDACRNCEYHSICGPYEELRVARKDRRALRDLLMLRAMP